MAGDRSFTDYVKSRFFNDLYSAAEEYVEQNWEGLDLDLRNIHRVGGVAMSDMTMGTQGDGSFVLFFPPTWCKIYIRGERKCQGQRGKKAAPGFTM